MILVAVIDIKIVATTGADLNHLVWNIAKNDFMMLLQLQMNKLEMPQLKEAVQEDSKESKLLKQ